MQAVETYEYILIDCPPSLGLLTINALTAAHSVLLPLQCEYYALEGIGRLLSVVKLVRQKLNPTLAIEGVLLTMHDSRTLLTRRVEEEARRYFGPTVYQTVIPRNIKLGEAPSHGQPIIHYDIGSSGADAYLRLTQEVLTHGPKHSVGTTSLLEGTEAVGRLNSCSSGVASAPNPYQPRQHFDTERLQNWRVPANPGLLQPIVAPPAGWLRTHRRERRWRARK